MRTKLTWVRNGVFDYELPSAMLQGDVRCLPLGYKIDNLVQVNLRLILSAFDSFLPIATTKLRLEAVIHAFQEPTQLEY